MKVRDLVSMPDRSVDRIVNDKGELAVVASHVLRDMCGLSRHDLQDEFNFSSPQALEGAAKINIRIKARSDQPYFELGVVTVRGVPAIVYRYEPSEDDVDQYDQASDLVYKILNREACNEILSWASACRRFMALGPNEEIVGADEDLFGFESFGPHLGFVVDSSGDVRDEGGQRLMHLSNRNHTGGMVLNRRNDGTLVLAGYGLPAKAGDTAIGQISRIRTFAADDLEPILTHIASLTDELWAREGFSLFSYFSALDKEGLPETAFLLEHARTSAETPWTFVGGQAENRVHGTREDMEQQFRAAIQEEMRVRLEAIAPQATLRARF